MKNESNVSPLYRILTLILGAGFLLLVFFGYYHEISAITQDLGRHLLTGELIWQSKEVPKINLYSYTYPNFSFINHHYLSEVIFYAVHSIVGFSGLLIFTTFLMIVSLSLLFIFTVKKLSFIPVSITSLLYLRILFERTDLRPEIFSYFFLTLFVVILFQYRERFTKWIYILPFLQLLWVNSHIYFPIGLLLLPLFSLIPFSPIKIISIQGHEPLLSFHSSQAWQYLLIPMGLPVRFILFVFFKTMATQSKRIKLFFSWSHWAL